jgi:iron-binding CDGSH zinc finger protein/divergent 4Fe-4S mono-cluster protein
VFDPDARPWVNVEAASANEIAASIESCPTGALSYVRTDGAPQETPESPTKVQPRPNGPLFVRGDIEVTDTEGNVIRRATRIALCRCGQSSNKPYCDLTHRAVGFKG